MQESQGFARLKNLSFRMFFNPVDYDGCLWREVKNSYKTNEVGFFITLGFFVCLSWSFVTYRRSAILEQRKRFVYQRYRRNKFLEDNLKLKSRHEIIHEKVDLLK